MPRKPTPKTLCRCLIGKAPVLWKTWPVSKNGAICSSMCVDSALSDNTFSRSSMLAENELRS